MQQQRPSPPVIRQPVPALPAPFLAAAVRLPDGRRLLLLTAATWPSRQPVHRYGVGCPLGTRPGRRRSS